MATRFAGKWNITIVHPNKVGSTLEEEGCTDVLVCDGGAISYTDSEGIVTLHNFQFVAVRVGD